MEHISIPVTPGAVTAVVSEAEVEERSHRGFRLVGIVASEAPEFIHDTTTEQDSQSYNTRTTTVSRGCVIKTPRFVMVQDGGAALEEKRVEIETLRLAAREAEITASTKQKEFDDLKRVSDAHEADSKRFSESFRRMSTERDDMRTAQRKFEGDIGKIRAAIGEREMKKILDEGKTP